jgi:hypothetical protein
VLTAALLLGIPTDAPSSPLPLPTTAKPTTIAKDNEDGSILSTGSGGVVVYPNHDGKYSDWGGVSSVCEMMRNFTSTGRQVLMVAINQSDWLCGWGQTGNKMGMYLQARALALYHDIAFEFAPSCNMIDNLVSWLPQSFLLGGGNDASNITGTIFAKWDSVPFAPQPTLVVSSEDVPPVFHGTVQTEIYV